MIYLGQPSRLHKQFWTSLAALAGMIVCSAPASAIENRLQLPAIYRDTEGVASLDLSLLCQTNPPGLVEVEIWPDQESGSNHVLSSTGLSYLPLQTVFSGKFLVEPFSAAQPTLLPTKYDWSMNPVAPPFTQYTPIILAPFSALPNLGPNFIVCSYDPSAIDADQFSNPRSIPPDWAQQLKPAMLYFQRHPVLSPDHVSISSLVTLGQLLNSDNQVMAEAAIQTLGALNLLTLGDVDAFVQRNNKERIAYAIATAERVGLLNGDGGRSWLIGEIQHAANLDQLSGILIGLQAADMLPGDAPAYKLSPLMPPREKVDLYEDATIIGAFRGREAALAGQPDQSHVSDEEVRDGCDVAPSTSDP